MRLLVVATALLSLFLSAPLSAQLLTLGEWFPLTNTRYGAHPGAGELATDGRNQVLFWTDGSGDVRVTKIVAGERRGGRAVLPASSADPTGYDAVWTGRQYLLVSGESLPGGAVLNGRLLDSTGEPIAPAFQLLPNATSPELAANGRAVLMVYRDLGAGLRYASLDNNGALQHATARLLNIPDEAASSYAVASNGTGFAAVVVTNHATRVFFFDENAQLTFETTLPSIFRDTVSIASNGGEYFIAGGSGSNIWGTLMNEEGDESAELLLDNSSGPAAQIATAWTGSSFAVGISTYENRLRFLYVDSEVRRILGRDAVIDGSLPSIVTAFGRVIASWRGEDRATRIAQLPLSPDETAAIATYAAGEQQLLATATGDEGTIVVWSETVDLESTYRAGVRSRSGDWVERLLTPASFSGHSVAAASNGHDFAVLLKPGNEGEMIVFRLDPRLRILGTTRLPFVATDIAWRGNDYVIVGSANDSLIVATLTSSGVLSSPKTVSNDVAYDGRLATIGGYTLISTIIPGGCPILCPIDDGNVATIQLNASLDPIGPLHDLDSFTTGPADVTADGNDFVLTWASGEKVMTARLRAGTNAAPSVQTLITWPRQVFDAHAVSTSQGLIYTWATQDGTRETRYLELFPRNGGASRRVEVPLDVRRFYTPSLVTTLASGDVAVLASLPNRDAPHHGSARVMMRIATFAGGFAELDAPRLTAVREGSRVRLSWTQPAAPVNGYRIEYRIGDGSWNELDEWYGPNELAEIVAAENRPIAFRIRAFSDAGTSAYSNAVYLGVPKRRAVR